MHFSSRSVEGAVLGSSVRRTYLKAHNQITSVFVVMSNRVKMATFKLKSHFLGGRGEPNQSRKISAELQNSCASLARFESERSKHVVSSKIDRSAFTLVAKVKELCARPG